MGGSTSTTSLDTDLYQYSMTTLGGCFFFNIKMQVGITQYQYGVVGQNTKMSKTCTKMDPGFVSQVDTPPDSSMIGIGSFYVAHIISI